MPVWLHGCSVKWLFAMRHIVSLIVVGAALSAAGCATHNAALSTTTNAPIPVTLSVSDFESSTFHFQISRSELLQTPKWRDGRQFPPLSPRKAETAALRRAQQLRPDVSKWNLEEISLLRWAWPDDDRWYYLVTFWRGDIAITGLPYFLRIPVLMDGTAVQAVNRPEKK